MLRPSNNIFIRDWNRSLGGKEFGFKFSFANSGACILLTVIIIHFNKLKRNHIMKRILFLFAVILLSSCTGYGNHADKSQIVRYQSQLKTVQSDTLLINIQHKIYNAFVEGLMSQNNVGLTKLGKKLETLYNEKNQKLILYWRSYLQFYSSIYYLKKGDKKKAEQEIDKGIDWMKEMKNRNSEDYALLSLLQGFSIQFSGMEAVFISIQVKKNAKTAIAMDSTNLRGYYVYASNDFYTPEKYGGGKQAEKYLLKAISLPAQKIKNVYLPSWGKEESYEMLIKLYIRQGKWNLAKKYFQKAINEYPDSYNIKQLASELVGK